MPGLPSLSIISVLVFILSVEVSKYPSLSINSILGFSQLIGFSEYPSPLIITVLGVTQSDELSKNVVSPDIEVFPEGIEELVCVEVENVTVDVVGVEVL